MKFQMRKLLGAAVCVGVLVGSGVAWAGSYKQPILSSINGYFVPDKSSFRKQDIDAVKVSVRDRLSTSAVVAKACVLDWTDWTAGTCGDAVQTTDAYIGYTDLKPRLNVWTAAYAGDFGYVYVGVLANGFYAPPQPGEIFGIEYIKL